MLALRSRSARAGWATVDWLPLIVDVRYHYDFDFDTSNNYFRTLGLGARLA